MATFAYVIPYKKSDGTANVRIRVTHNRKKKEFATNIILQKDDFTKNGKIKNYAVLDTLEDLLSSYRKKCQTLGLRINRMEVGEVADFVLREDTDNFKLDFFQYGVRFASDKKVNTKDGVETALNSFKAFIGTDKLDINEMSLNTLQSYVDHCEKKLANNTVLGYVRKLKTVYLSAVNEFNDEDTGYTPIKKNPFRKLRLPKKEETKKRSVSVETIRKIASLDDVPNYGKYMYSVYNVAKDLFTLSFLLVGMNAVDLYNCPPADEDGYITYNRTKTKDRRTDRAEIRIKVPQSAESIIEKYKDKDGTHLLCFHRHYTNARFLNTILSNGMIKVSRDIGEKVTFYSARHSWATIAVNDVGIDKYVVHLALNHTDAATAITDTYIRKDFSVIDKANERVLDFVKLL